MTVIVPTVLQVHGSERVVKDFFKEHLTFMYVA